MSFFEWILTISALSGLRNEQDRQTRTLESIERELKKQNNPQEYEAQQAMARRSRRTQHAAKKIQNPLLNFLLKAFLVIAGFMVWILWTVWKNA